MRTVSSLIALALLTFASTGQANVCGSSVSRFLLPDYICFDESGRRLPYESCSSVPIGGQLSRQRVDFTIACSTHDACYGTAGASKNECDANFYENLKVACRAQTTTANRSRAFRACIETALQYNDVVRGQPTRRVGPWMIGQVPFTGQSGCEAYIAGQKRAGGTLISSCNESASSLAAVATGWIGKWNGPEETYLEISANAGGYRVSIRDLDRVRRFNAVTSDKGLSFERDGIKENLVAGTGRDTGMKWLDGKAKCLIIKSGEGYCRD